MYIICVFLKAAVSVYSHEKCAKIWVETYISFCQCVGTCHRTYVKTLVSVLAYAGIHHSTCVEGREDPSGICSLLLQWGSWGLNSGCHVSTHSAISLVHPCLISVWRLMLSWLATAVLEHCRQSNWLWILSTWGLSLPLITSVCSGCWASVPCCTFFPMTANRNLKSSLRFLPSLDDYSLLLSFPPPSQSESVYPYLWAEAPAMRYSHCREEQRTPPSPFSLCSPPY